jgi:hypothetical protein
MTIECIGFVPVNKNTCLGFANVYIQKWGVEIYGLTYHEKDGKRWVNFPSKPYTDKEGKKCYASYFRFRETPHYTLFCDKAKEAIQAYIVKNNIKLSTLTQESSNEDVFNTNNLF